MKESASVTPALSTEIDKRLDPVATAVEVRVRLKPGVDLLRVYGSRRLSEAEASRVRTQEVAVDQQTAKRDHIAKDREDDVFGLDQVPPRIKRGPGHRARPSHHTARAALRISR
jgi:Ca-activated chloride channel family protein